MPWPSCPSTSPDCLRAGDSPRWTTGRDRATGQDHHLADPPLRGEVEVVEVVEEEEEEEEEEVEEEEVTTRAWTG